MEIVPSANSVAFIIAIENYRFSDKNTGIQPVKYAKNDAIKFKELLINHFDFDESQITLWLDEDAIKSALENELPYLIRNLSSHDRFYFYYAGHGFFQNGTNRLTVWDTHPFNLLQTTVSLKDVLIDPLEKSGCNQSLIFLDACASDFTDIVESRDLISNMDKREFEDFINSTNYTAIFSSCSPGEKSYPSSNLKHGIWTWHLLQALAGEADKAIVNDLYITDISLKDYLRHEIPRYIRKNTNIKAKQTPFSIVSASNTFEIRKLPEPEDQENQALQKIQLKLNESFLRKLETESISSLPGFDKKKRHFAPDSINNYADNFVKNLLEEDISEELKEVYTNSKSILKLRKRDIEKDVGHGGGTVETEFFRYFLDVEQNPKECSEALIKRTLVLRVPTSQLPDDFDNIFPVDLNEIVIPISGSMDFDDLVESFEDLKERIGGNLSEDEDEGVIEYRLGDDNTLVTLLLFEKELVVQPKRASGCLNLIERAETSLRQLTGNKKKLLK